MKPSARWGRAIAIALLFGCAAFPAWSAEYPSQTIRWIIPYGTGGAYDALARGIAPALGKQLGVNVVVETIPGPDGYNRIYSAKPDGYTIGMADPVGEFAQAVVNPVPYKLQDMTWLGRINAASNLAVASKKSGFTSFDQVKASTQPVRVAAFGVSAPLVQMILLSQATGFKMASVNFRTPGDVIFGVVRGDADLGQLGVLLWTKHIEAGSVTPLLIWDETRDPRLPNVPTLREIGQGDLVNMMAQRSVIGPPKLPIEIQEKLIEAFRKTVSEGEGLAFIKRGNFETNQMWGTEFQRNVAEIHRAIDKYGDVLKKFTTQ